MWRVVERFRFKVPAPDVNALLTTKNISTANSIPSSRCSTYFILETGCVDVIEIVI
jgi:hypothetical protein